ncbi:hypothetical protein ABPG72_018623 [Tetrahymena utriculariae]
MKFVGIPILLSVLLLLSTSVYFVMHQNNSRFINLESELKDSLCLNIDVVQVGHAYPSFDLYAQNICVKPKRFTLIFKSLPDNPSNTFISQCLGPNQEEYTPLIFQFSTITQTFQEDC